MKFFARMAAIADVEMRWNRLCEGMNELDAPMGIQPTYPFAKTVLTHSYVC